ncbi:polysaccharide deacetylase family protein [Nonomuraea gerenzanensis]|uniref:Peptidoglycan N-acetylglucosamine deacetylase n=1 Tax=Nonomuraea gerenzanensis TaxID=93944 RepID=A0A1M4EK40_9ACTN|nr:polysaccharide deacetylase family protein [Nonomuraea gerenzanensis]UBU10790.1 polysaccharide deacetylase family protein [Nonomuraea gerenzanensis]SBO99220.1 Peptidoglycan N-acetylglucosamine deacetylase [Nonomuraea gerenzanensis]
MSRQVSSLLAIAAVCVTLAPAPAFAQAPKKEPVDCEQVKCIALTFDDGPSKYAGTLLDTLKKYDAKATFFLEGQYVKSRPQYVKRMVAEGHELGNHSYSHPDFTKSDAATIKSEIQKTQDAVKKAAGVEPKLLRPPYGMADLQVSDIAAEFGMPMILWTAGSQDWSSKNVDAIQKQTLAVAKPNSIILMHDWVKQTVDGMPSLIKTLQNKGYHLVTVSDVIKGENLEPGDIFPVPSGWEK